MVADTSRGHTANCGATMAKNQGSWERADSVSAISIEDRVAVSVAEAVRLSGLGRTFLFAEMRAARLRYVKKGRRRLIRLDDLRAYLNKSD